MVLLSSSAFDDPLLLPFCLEQLRLDAAALKTSVVISASLKKGDGTNAIKTMQALLDAGAVNSRFVDLFDGPAALEELDGTDLIVINGGNPFLLWQAIQGVDALGALRRWAGSKLVVGVSAGGMVFSPGLHYLEEFNRILGIEGMDNPGLSNVDGLGLFDEYFFPHFDRFSSQTPELDVSLSNLEREKGIRLFRQNNGDTAHITNRTIRAMVPGNLPLE